VGYNLIIFEWAGGAEVGDRGEQKQRRIMVSIMESMGQG
jgi:hypothetical protein